MILKIAIISLSSVLGLILVGVLIWRLYDFLSKKDTQKQSTKVGYISKKTIEKLNFLNSLTNEKILINILVKNNFAKKKFSLFSGIAINQEKVYVLSDIISSSKDNQLLINSKGAFWINEKKRKKIDNWETQWLEEQKRWIEKRFNKNFEIFILVDENIKKDNIKNESEFKAVNIYELNEILNSKKEKNFVPEKVIQIFTKNNVFKERK
ncbi:hypothetical protein [Mesomycoplasma lagogenitalium]|uniref:NERD domain-containing protein n=1 Tax=Mesomycoplasma lagogenitalium TaxID=171286 RepID=A0ABY8LUS7_9BACT|nr:hypothetical protein [Mesomycoplasma lagogenitalium]WGI36974.1 hypothetical protein QEG99_01670 [Mesomycoplasma lagogenitalium]